MQNDYTSKKFKKWLDKLQQESWQLELIISGFVIFGLFQAIDPLIYGLEVFKAGATSGLIRAVIGVFGFSIILSVYTLLFNLIIHLVLRGLWIGAVGLRYYSGDIDFETLNYAPKFDKYLKRKIGSFDTYIGKLEDYCSIIFSLSFLLVFIALSFAIILGVIFLASFIAFGNETPTPTRLLLVVLFVMGYLGLVLLTLIDFLGQGVLKKNNTIATLYFPVYWVMSYLSLSFLYRPILYNFLDHKKGKRILFWMVPFYILIGIIASVEFEQSNFHSIDFAAAGNLSKRLDYLESSKGGQDIFEYVAIEARRIEKRSMRVFVFNEQYIENAVTRLNSDIEPKEDRRGLKSMLFTDTPWTENNASLSDFERFIQGVNEIVTLKIDSLDFKSDFSATTYDNGQKGYETYLNLKNLQQGKHYFSMTTKKLLRDSIVDSEKITIPFWYYPE